MDLSSICVKETKSDKKVNSHIEPIFATSSFGFDIIQDSIDIFTGKNEGFVYSRYNNPTIEAVATKIGKLEGFDIEEEVFSMMTSSGMAAIGILMNSLLKSGDEILTQGNIYGGTTELFTKVFSNQDIKTNFANLNDLDQIDVILRGNEKIKLLYLETPSNPTLDCIDLQKISELAKKYDVYTVVDNTFATPILQRPFNFGIDFIIHSATKYINGHGNSIAGVIVGKDILNHKSKVWTTLKLYGATCNAWDAWLTNQGLKTLPLRMQKHSQNSTSIAEYLEQNSNIPKVNHLSLKTHPHHEMAKKQMQDWGGMISFEVGSNMKHTMKFIDNLSFCSQAPTLGDVDTLVLHPATSSHLNVDKNLREQNGISDTLVRMSVGIEKVDDIISDIDQALKSI